MAARIHPTSVVADSASLGEGTQIWAGCLVRDHVKIGSNCNLGRNVYVETSVTIGSNVKIQNNVSIYTGVTIDDGVFVGPHVCFTNDMFPRAINPDGSVKSPDDWQISETRVHRGAALGANATIRCGVRIGEWALVAAGSVVTRDVPAHALVRGNPARVVGTVCACGKPVKMSGEQGTCKCGRILVRSGDTFVMQQK